MSRDLQTFAPNVASSWEWSDNGTVLTIHLHEGIRWSDGTPFDANDIEFWWQYDILNPEITPSIPGEFVHAGEPAVFEKIDDYTFSWTFAAPNPTIINNLRQAWA